MEKKITNDGLNRLENMKTPLEYEADILEQCISDLQIVVNGMHERGEYKISKALEELNFKIEELVKDRINIYVYEHKTEEQ